VDDPATVRRTRTPWPWLVAGLAAAGALVALAALSHAATFAATERVLTDELGPVENATWLAFLGAAVLAALVARAARRRGERGTARGYAAFAAFAFVAAMEEISWGQAFFAWTTPPWLSLWNAQGESNLHNLEPFQNLSSLGVLLFALCGLVLAWLGSRGRLTRFAVPVAIAPLLGVVACMAAVETVNDFTIVPQPAANIIGTLSELAELYGAIACLGYAWLNGRMLRRAWAADDAAAAREADAAPSARLAA
jgi:hypothetical protein